MSWGFEKGRIYNRRKDIHAVYDGQQQGGIITPAKFPIVFIITGEEGLRHGYDDQTRSDGVFEYYGEGQVGDMQMTNGNRAIAEHSWSGKSLLLFQKTPEGLRFKDEMVYEFHLFRPAPDRNGDIRTAIVFELRRLEAVTEAIEIEPAATTTPLAELRKRALEAAQAPTGTTKGTRTIYQRSQIVRNFVLARANGACEACETPAPFVRADGTPYLEPHHIRRRSDGGPDHIAHVIATCPNCHRRVHFGADGTDYNATLAAKMKTIEPGF